MLTYLHDKNYLFACFYADTMMYSAVRSYFTNYINPDREFLLWSEDVSGHDHIGD